MNAKDNAPFSTVLVVDDEANLRTVLKARIRRGGWDCITAKDGFEALNLLAEYPEIKTVITDLKMPRMNGVQLMRKIHETRPDLPIIILTAFGSINNAVEAVKAGAFDYMEKPFDKDQLIEVVNKALLSYHSLSRSAPSMSTGDHPGRYGMIGKSSAIGSVFRLIDRISQTNSTVLVSGESGTGKELVAKAIHQASKRVEKPFIRVNCAAIPDNLLESELFGHEAGAFTGATSAKPGRFELAQGGTILLDEVGELPITMQAKLLRVLQENEYERVGGIVTLTSDARVIASTNKNLLAETQAGNFREDLYYRLNVVPVILPPLRDRTEDILILADFFTSKFNTQSDTEYALSSDALELLKGYSWPGNIRELQNVIERTLLLTEESLITIEHLPRELRALTPGVPAQKMELSDSGLKEVVKRETSRIEKDLISKALTTTGGNVTKAAKVLRISRKGLQNKIKELQINEVTPLESQS